MLLRAAFKGLSVLAIDLLFALDENEFEGGNCELWYCCVTSWGL